MAKKSCVIYFPNFYLEVRKIDIKILRHKVSVKVSLRIKHVYDINRRYVIKTQSCLLVNKYVYYIHKDYIKEVIFISAVDKH